jgi:hypothetical protein
MTEQEKTKFRNCLLNLYGLGNSNFLVRKHFDSDESLELHIPKNWLNYTTELLEILDR